MSQRLNLFAIVALAVMSISIMTNNAQTPQNSSADEAAIRQAVQQVQDGWNAHDAKDAALSYAPDADYINVNGAHRKGREAIEKGYAAIFSTIYKESRNSGTIKSIRFLRPDVALAHVAWDLEWTVGGETRKGHAISTMVLTKGGGKWSIAAFQNTPIQEQGR